MPVVASPSRGKLALFAMEFERENARLTRTRVFDVIAAVPGMTGLALQSMLQTSHREMPNLILQSDERADLIAYILSLRAN